MRGERLLGAKKGHRQGAGYAGKRPRVPYDCSRKCEVDAAATQLVCDEPGAWDWNVDRAHIFLILFFFLIDRRACRCTVSIRMIGLNCIMLLDSRTNNICELWSMKRRGQKVWLVHLITHCPVLLATVVTIVWAATLSIAETGIVLVRAFLIGARQEGCSCPISDSRWVCFFRKFFSPTTF